MIPGLVAAILMLSIMAVMGQAVVKELSLIHISEPTRPY